MKTVIYKLDGMSCWVSEDRIKTGLSYLDGVIDSRSNCVEQLAEVTFDEAIVSEAEIIARIEEMEFKVAGTL